MVFWVAAKASQRKQPRQFCFKSMNSPSPWRPEALLATWFGSGYLPKAPGTWGSIAALPFAWVIAINFGSTGLLLATVLIFIIGIWASGAHAANTGLKDPGEIVIDEVAGLWLSLAFAPVDIYYYAAGFVLFRIADITKPWPASWADKKLTGGFGIMLDDIFAGAYAALLLYAAQYFLVGTS